jgi:hypothetical protein
MIAVENFRFTHRVPFVVVLTIRRVKVAKKQKALLGPPI